MRPSVERIKSYYDEHAAALLDRYVKGNPRVERALETIERYAPPVVHDVLEIGCGVGETCWRVSKRWPNSRVLGIDISERAIELARRLFGSERVSFRVAAATDDIHGRFDLIVLMDVYEHIETEDRVGLHESLKRIRNENGRIILTFPTPRHLAWLRAHHPHAIQPIDQDVDATSVTKLARDTATSILLYEEVSVWNEGDYAHAVLGSPAEWPPGPPSRPRRGSKKVVVGLVDRIRRVQASPGKVRRLAHLKRRLRGKG